jgi:hypothetical protein
LGAVTQAWEEHFRALFNGMRRYKNGRYYSLGYKGGREESSRETILPAERSVMILDSEE